MQTHVRNATGARGNTCLWITNGTIIYAELDSEMITGCAMSRTREGQSIRREQARSIDRSIAVSLYLLKCVKVWSESLRHWTAVHNS